MTIRRFARIGISFMFASLLAACNGGGQMTPLDNSSGLPPVQDPATATQDSNPVATMSSTSLVQPANTSFLPSSWGKIGTFQIFDETNNGTISSSAAAAHGMRYSSVWGARPDLARTWRNANSGLKSSYYFIAVTDFGTAAWGGLGHSLSWWQANHPTWVLYACTSSGVPTHTPAYVSVLKNIPLDFHNPAVAQYQAATAGRYATAKGYTALAADEVTYWPAGSGGAGYYPCGTWSGSTFVRRYSSKTDRTYGTDMVNWVKTVHSYIRSNYPGLKLIANHPGSGLSANEMTLLANTDAVMDESGFTDYGRPYKISVATEATWMRYAQQHGVSVMINQDWGSASSINAQQIDYSVATYLLGNEQSAAAFISSHTGYGTEVWRPEYATEIGAPCGEYYGGPTIFYRRFANAIVVVNASGVNVSVSLPAGHKYTDLEGRSIRPLGPYDGYVLKTTNGCT